MIRLHVMVFLYGLSKAHIAFSNIPNYHIDILKIFPGDLIMTNIKGNGTTIGKFLLIMFAARIIAISAAHGINLPVDQVELAGYLGILLGFLYSVCDSYFKNDYRWTHFKKILSFFDKEIEDTPEPEEITNIEDDDPTTEPEITEENTIVVGDVTDEDES